MAWVGVQLSWSRILKGWRWVDLTRLVKHPLGVGEESQGDGVGRCLTRFVNHPQGGESLDRHAAGSYLVFHFITLCSFCEKCLVHKN